VALLLACPDTVRQWLKDLNVTKVLVIVTVPILGASLLEGISVLNAIQLTAPFVGAGFILLALYRRIRPE
jgi:hypothetical protein